MSLDVRRPCPADSCCTSVTSSAWPTLLYVYTVHILQCSLCRAVYTIGCDLYSVKCTLYSVQCTVYSVQCTVYSVQYSAFSNTEKDNNQNLTLLVLLS